MASFKTLFLLVCVLFSIVLLVSSDATSSDVHTTTDQGNELEEGKYGGPGNGGGNYGGPGNGGGNYGGPGNGGGNHGGPGNGGGNYGGPGNGGGNYGGPGNGGGNYGGGNHGGHGGYHGRGCPYGCCRHFRYRNGCDRCCRHANEAPDAFFADNVNN